MTFKKKLVVSTIAASMAMTAFAGIPLSTKGLAEKIGIVQVAEAATKDTFSNKEFVDKMVAIHEKLEWNETGRQEVQKVRDYIRDDLKLSEFDSLLDPIWSKLKQSGLTEDDKQGLFEVFKAVFGMTYDPSFADLEDIKENYQTFLQGLGAKAGQPKLNVDDLVGFGNVVEQAIASKLQSASPEQIVALYGNKNGERNKFIAEVLSTARAHQDNAFSAVLRAWDDNEDEDKNITIADLVTTFNGFRDALGQQESPDFEVATKAMVAAYIGYKGSSNVAKNGLSATVTFSVFGKNITSLLQWSSDSSNIKVGDDENNKGKITATSSGTATITAKLGNDYVVFKQKVSLSNDSTSYPSSGGFVGGGISSPADQAVQDLNNLKSQIANATGADKDALVQKAIDTAVKALEETLLFKASSKVTVSEGTAKLVLNKSDLNALTSGTKKIVDKLKEVAPGAEAQLPVLEATVDFGTVSVSNATIELSADLVKELAAVGISSVNTLVSGFKAKLPTSSQFANGIVFTVKKSEAAADLTTLPIASDVYDFELKLGGEVTTILPAPIQITIPVKNTGGLDTELLTLAKIVENKLQFVGGKVSGGVITEARHKFSSYVVVENKVSFGDTSSVQSWAGRQIQVLAAKGIINGKKDGVFAPQDNVTRAEFAKMLIEALDLDSETTTNKFSDVKAGDWFAPYVAAAAEKGIINGRTATTFVPNATITRAEMATMVARALKATAGLKDVEDVKAALAGFSDASSVHATLEAGVALASSKELIIGSNGKFRPNDTANRAEAAVIIYRAFNYTE